jgi:hypothetical protein
MSMVSRRGSEQGYYPPNPTVDPRTGDELTCGLGFVKLKSPIDVLHVPEVT